MTQTNSLHALDQIANLAGLRAALLEWFAAAGRDLPWRRTRDPYKIMVSEIMLQQTQVDRVIPKYHAFLEAFPTLAALAAAPTADVIRAWSGLGYNRRAINMQRTARAVIEEHGGEFPRDVAALLKLPGIGPYTAGAIACFAFEQDVAFIDTNIRRVVQRLFVGPAASAAATDARLIEIAQIAVPPGQGWAWNQAIMELGALVCTAAAPACWRCPARAHCRAYAAWRSADEQVFADNPAEPARQRRVAERRGATRGRARPHSRERSGGRTRRAVRAHRSAATGIVSGDRRVTGGPCPIRSGDRRQRQSGARRPRKLRQRPGRLGVARHRRDR